MKSKRAALNRAAHALAEFRTARDQARETCARLTREVQRLAKEYYKLARRAAFVTNANMRAGPLTAHELATLRRTANMVKTMSVAERTMKRTPLPKNMQNMVVYATFPTRRA